MTAQNNIPIEHAEITEGPGKFELSVALFTWKPEKPIVEFSAAPRTYCAKIYSVEGEDGSGNCWNITGVAHDKHSSLRRWRKFRGFYRTGGPGGKGGYIQFLE